VKGHVDSETLAACREGLLPRRKAGQVAAHVAHCAQCAGHDAQLAELPALLARSPAPPMPAALTARIEAALAAEAAARPATADTAGAPAAAARGHRKTPAPGPGRSRLVLRVAAVAAAVVVLAGGGYGLMRLLAGGSVASPTASEPVLGPEQAPVKSAAGSRAPGAQANGATGSRAALSPLVVTSGTNYEPSKLQTQVRATLLRYGHGAKSSVAGSGHSPAPYARDAVLQACLQRVPGGRRAELVDEASYESRPATIIVIPGARANTLRVVVVETRCTAAAPGPIFSTLLPSPG
jgi:hypothetical protein